MAATLEQLVTVRSQLATWFMRYLRCLMNVPNWGAPPYLAGRRLTDLYILPDVLKEQSRGDQDRGQARRKGAASLAEEEQGRFWHDDDKRTRVAWERERKTIERAVILGRPGEGKTMLAKMSVRALAEASLTELTTQQKGVLDVAIPVCVRLADVAERGSVEVAVEAAIRISLKDAYPKEKNSPIIEVVVGHILSALFTDRCWLFLDALDEVPDLVGLKASLESLRNAGCHVVVTSRPYGYDSSVLPFAFVIEYELAPFTPRQRRQFVGNWFKNDPTRRARVLELAQGNPQFGDLTRNALLLTLTCATTEHHDLPPDARRVDLYRFIVRDMVRRVWKEERLSDDDERVDEMILLLEQIAWNLFRDDPKRTMFSYREMKAAIQAVERDKEPEVIMKELREDGLIISPARGQRMFLHRTFLEFLAAEHVAHEADCLSAIEQLLTRRDFSSNPWVWSRPAAAEMLCFLVGCLDHKPNLLLSHFVERGGNKPWQSAKLHLLATRALADADKWWLNLELAHSLTYKVLGWWFHEPDPEDTYDLYKDVIPALAHEFGIEVLLKKLNDKNGNVREMAAQGLGLIACERAVDALVSVLQNDEAAAVRANVADALGQIGNERAVNVLVDRLLNDESKIVRYWSANALGQIGGEQAIEALLEIARNDESLEVRKMAERALEYFRPQREPVPHGTK